MNIAADLDQELKLLAFHNMRLEYFRKILTELSLQVIDPADVEKIDSRLVEMGDLRELIGYYLNKAQKHQELAESLRTALDACNKRCSQPPQDTSVGKGTSSGTSTGTATGTSGGTATGTGTSTSSSTSTGTATSTSGGFYSPSGE
jgi:hypothetical protein